MKWAACAALLACACSPSSKCGPTTATVARVIDGDTIELTSGEKIRYLLVDAPETTLGKNDCYGAEAAAFNTDQVDGKQVYITYDEGECTDRYARLLAYITPAGGKEVNKAMVEKGLACVLYVSPGGMSRKTEFEDAQSVAKTNRTGLWGACNPVTCQ